MFKSINNQPEFPKFEEEILKFWNEHGVFASSKEIRKGKKEYVFYDGPPFATGLPHYGHILASTIKDIVPRYYAMRGNYVERRFGWDCHGLPVEMEIQKQLNLNTAKEILDYGVGRFNDACRKIVQRYAGEWESVISRMGRWVDFKNDYKTMNTPFMESVWWVFKTLYDKGLIYRGFKVMPYSWKAGTILSNFEENLNYKDVQDYAITVKFKAKVSNGNNDKAEYFLAWTTTPWTLLGNLILSVGDDIPYVKIKHLENQEYYYLGKAACEKMFKPEEYEIVETLTGKDLIGRKYEPIFSYAQAKLKPEEASKAFTIYSGAGVVSEEEGVGIVHMAPAYGEEDFNICSDIGLPCYDPIDSDGAFMSEIDFIVGENFKTAEKIIVQKLKAENHLLKQTTTKHSYPYCWRTDTPLMYKAFSTWFVNVTKIQESIVANNQKIHWEPAHIKDGRFGKWLENTRDWAISRNRFWGNPIPIWESEDGELLCFGDIASLEQASGVKISDIHKEFMDEITFVKDGKTFKRVPEVLDCWFESGSMPYGQNHYPFEHKDSFDQTFPADFISEGLDQTRGWFYTLLVVSSGLFNKPAFQNVVVSGLILAEDGKKMSKRLKNYPDPNYVLDQYGADALRIYLISSGVIKGETLKFSENGLKDIMKAIMIPLWNVLAFFINYAAIDKWKPPNRSDKETYEKMLAELEQPLDRWLFSYRETLIKKVNQAMESYQLFNAVPPIIDFVEKLTNTYVRRSRRRFWKSESDNDKHQAYFTLYESLRTFAVVLAPFAPFISEKIYQLLRVENDKRSVHLEDYPLYDFAQVNKKLEAEMEWVDQVLSMGRALRLKNKLKIRQPLSELVVITKPNDKVEGYVSRNESTILDELNVKFVRVSFNETAFVTYHAKIDFKKAGKTYGHKIKAINEVISKLAHEDIVKILAEGSYVCMLDGEELNIPSENLDVRRNEKSGHVVINQGELSCALDIELTDKLLAEGHAREFVNRIQKTRKDLNLEFTDRIIVTAKTSEELVEVLRNEQDYICRETLCNKLALEVIESDSLPDDFLVEDINTIPCFIQVVKAS